MKTITCQLCGKEKRTLSANVGKYCSMACKSAAAERVERVCPGCGQRIVQLRSQAVGREYCSRPCRQEHKRKLRTKICEVCSGEYQYHRPEQRFCSLKCRSEGVQSPAYQDGRSAHPQYGRWYNMMMRCHNPHSPYYSLYGGRGIEVHPDWHTPANFYQYVEEQLGPCPPKHSIDRINNNRGYEPGNIRWATPLEQYRNRRAYITNPQGSRKIRKGITQSAPNVWVIR